LNILNALISQSFSVKVFYSPTNAQVIVLKQY